MFNDADDIRLLPLEGGGKAKVLLKNQFVSRGGSLSPDGRWLAYVSNESGRFEVYVRPFQAAGADGPSLGEGKWQVSKDGAAQDTPRWRADGKEIIYRGIGLAPTVAVDSVEVNPGGTAFQAGIPKRLFQLPIVQDWDVTADGKRFLVLVPPGQQNTQMPLTVVLNWQADLKH